MTDLPAQIVQLRPEDQKEWLRNTALDIVLAGETSTDPIKTYTAFCNNGLIACVIGRIYAKSDQSTALLVYLINGSTTEDTASLVLMIVKKIKLACLLTAR
jgi:hypothetical protein